MARHTRLSGTKPAISSGKGNCSSTSVRKQPNFSPLTWYLKVISSEVASKTSLGYMSPTICRSEEHTSELQSLMRISYAVFCLKKKKKLKQTQIHNNTSD